MGDSSLGDLLAGDARPNRRTARVALWLVVGLSLAFVGLWWFGPGAVVRLAPGVSTSDLLLVAIFAPGVGLAVANAATGGGLLASLAAALTAFLAYLSALVLAAMFAVPTPRLPLDAVAFLGLFAGVSVVVGLLAHLVGAGVRSVRAREAAAD